MLPGGSRTTSVGRPSGTLSAPGVPRSVAMKMVGHKTEAIYRRYAIVSDADLQAAARKLAAISVSGDSLVTAMSARP